MSVEDVNGCHVLRLTKHTLDQVAASKTKSLTITLEDDTYVLTVSKAKEGEE